MHREVHCILSHQTAGARFLPAQSLVHAVKGLECSGFPRSQSEPMGEHVSAWSGGGGGLESPLLSQGCFLERVCSLSLCAFPFPRPSAAQECEQEKAAFLSSPLFPNCFLEG